MLCNYLAIAARRHTGAHAAAIATLNDPSATYFVFLSAADHRHACEKQLSDGQATNSFGSRVADLLCQQLNAAHVDARHEVLDDEHHILMAHVCNLRGNT